MISGNLFFFKGKQNELVVTTTERYEASGKAATNSDDPEAILSSYGKLPGVAHLQSHRKTNDCLLLFLSPDS